MTEHLIVPEDRAGQELDEYLCLAFPLISKGFLRQQIHEGRVLLDGSQVRPSKRVRSYQVVSIEFDEGDVPKRPHPAAEPVPILYEDEAVLVVDKPAGLSVEPERWHRDAACLSGSLLAEAMERVGGEDERGRPVSGSLEFRPRLVHRIDKGTSGCVLVAKSIEVERALRAAFEQGRVRKEYLTLVDGEYPDGDSWEWIDEPISPDSRRTGRMRVASGGKPSRTRVKVVEQFFGFTSLRCEPATGRTHQIRVHLTHEGFPLMVDPLYGRRDCLLLSEIKRGYRPKPGSVEQPLISRVTLHAAALEFPDLRVDETDTQNIRVEAPTPKDIARTLKQLAKVRPYTR